MTVFTEHLVESNRDLWMAMSGHPFVLGLADGTLPDGALQAWVQQDRIFVVEERRVVAALRAHGLPSRLGALLAGPVFPALTSRVRRRRWSAADLRRLGFRLAQGDVALAVQ